MSKFEWVELETLSTEVSHLKSRIDAARASKNYGRARLLEREMAEVSERRNRVLAAITDGLDAAAPGGPQPATTPAKADQPKSANQKHESAAKATPDSNPTSPAPALGTNAAVDSTMWDKLTAADLERVKRRLASRRSETLARHAEELKALEAAQSKIDVIEKVIAAFTQKFKLRNTAEVIPVERERVPVTAA